MSAESDPQTDRATDPTVTVLDLFDPGFQPEAPEVHAAREACWYARTPQGYAVLRYAEVAALLRDRRLRQGSAAPLAAQGITEGPLADWMRTSLLTQEGEPHARLRRLVSQAFTPRAVDALRPTMRAAAHALIDGFAAQAVEEVMRVRPAVPVISRVATEDFEFEGLRIATGTLLSLFVASANTDPRVFGTDGFDITRERAAQLTFGGGLHHCLGAPLARAEMAEALPILAVRLRDPELAGDVPWRPALGIRGPVALPIRFRTAA